ncbi:MAG: glutaredoxin family protein [Chlorobiaceae bacterium]|nr:glutaredoxin family protein [Chlorobiaceae bacterium]NTW11388.1 glutaredoxin family protein [Chlorobiaceae bacterium]
MSKKQHIVTLYGKKECCLCDDAMAIIQKVAASVPFRLEKKDITEDPELLERFGTTIPVIFVDGVQAFKYRVNERRFRELLS